MIEMCCGNWSAVVAPECGANVISLRNGKTELLRTPDSLEQLFGRPCLYGIPLLLPANRTKEGAFCFEGVRYRLPVNEPAFGNHIHGLLKDAPFHVERAQPNCVVTVLENKGEYYPFPFLIRIEDSLCHEGFTRRLMLKNTGTAPMPYTLAFHTAFAEPDFFCVPIDHCIEMDETYTPTGKHLPLTAQQQAYRDGMEPNGSKISGVYTSCGSTVQIGDFRMSVSAQFDHWVLFNGSGSEGYLCIEPQCGAVNGLNNETHKILHPNSQEQFVVSIQRR